MSAEGFDSLNSVFNTTFSAADEAKTELKTLNEEKGLVQKEINSVTKIELKDQKYLEDKIKNLLDSSERVRDKLENSLKMDSGASRFESYAKLVEVITKQIEQLIQLNRQLFEIEVVHNPETITPKEKTGIITMNGLALLDMINQVKKDSSLNTVDTSFEVETESDENKKL